MISAGTQSRPRSGNDTVDDARELLAPLHLTLKARWDETRVRWRDDVAADFERRFWTEIDQASLDFLAECDRFEEVLSRAESVLQTLD